MIRTLLIGLFCLFIAPVYADTDAAWQAYQQGQYNRAIQLWEAQLSNASDTEQLQIYSQLAAAYQALGMHRQVFLQLDKALKLADEQNAPTAQILTLSQLSDAWLSIGDLDAALEDAEAAVKLTDNTDDAPQLSAHALNSLANALVAVDELEEAFPLYQQASEAAQRANADDLQLKIALNQLKTAVQGFPLDTVLPLSDRLWSQLQTLSSNQANAGYLLTYGQHLGALLTDPQIAEANRQQLTQRMRDAFAKALNIAQSLQQPRLMSLAYGYQGEIALKHGQLAQAQTLLQQAIFYAHQGQFADVLYRWQWHMAEILEQQGKTEEAIQSYKTAIRVLFPIQQQLEVGQRVLSGSFDENVRPVYYGLADLLLKQAAQATHETVRQELLHSARDIIEQAKLAELLNYFQDDCVSQAKAQQRELDQLVDGAAIIYPIALADRLVLLVSAGEGIQPFTVPVTRQQLDETALELRVRLQTRANKRYFYPAKTLYDWLITPLLPYLQQHQIDTLIFVPDGLLRTVPLATLYDGEQFLIEQYALAITPGLTLLDPQTVDWSNAEVLLAGLSDAVQGYPALPNVPKELSHIAEAAKRSTTLLNTDFTSPKLRETLKATEFAAMHLATHGEFSADPAYTYLLSYDEQMTMDKVQKVIGLGSFRKQPIELLTLSACRTAVGDDRAALGLAGVAVKAGARSAIATLWFVDDEATALTMTRFYQTLMQTAGMTKAKALQQVQVELLHNVRFEHPAYWAPFLLIGNWL